MPIGIKAAVVIASYNRKLPLERLLQNLARQNAPSAEWEAIVVLDGSSDGSREFLEAVVPTTPFALRYFWQENAGQSVARDHGIHSTTADTIIIIDDDMEIAPEFIQAHIQAAECHFQKSIVIGRVIPEQGWRKKPLHEAVREEFMQRLHTHLAQPNVTPNASAFITQNVSFPRQLYLQVGGFDPLLRLDEDRELGIRLERAGGQFLFCQGAWAIHRSDVGGYEKWFARQFEYGRYAVQVWHKHNKSLDLHPLRNYINGSRLNRTLVTLAGRWEPLASLMAKLLAATGATFRLFGIFSFGIFAYRALLSLQYHRGVKAALGGWPNFRNAAEEFRCSSNRVEGSSMTGSTHRSSP